MKTPEQITEAAAEAMVREHKLLRGSGESARNSLAWELVSGDTLIVEHALEELVRRAIETDRAQRSQMERFGTAVYQIMDGEEWSSDTSESIAAYAAEVLKKPFSEPGVYDHLAGEAFTPTEGAAIDIDGERWDYIDGGWTSEVWGALPLNQPIENYDFNIIHKGV